MDTVPARLGTDIDDGIAHTAGSGIEYLVLICDTDGHGIDQNVAVIRRMEIGFAAHRRHANAVSIAADAGHDAFDQMLHPGVIGRAEAQRVEIRDRARAHGEHVAQYAAHARRRALIRLDITGMVVALHLEDGRLPIANVDHAGILARPANDLRPLGRQLLQMKPRAFVTAMLRPHDRKDAQLDHIGFPPKRLQHIGIFILAEPMFGDNLGRNRWRGGCIGHG